MHKSGENRTTPHLTEYSYKPINVKIYKMHVTGQGHIKKCLRLACPCKM
jgi:hypothetical protein